jgi:hypothetical protein
MVREKQYHVYIMASITGVLYVGVTGFLVSRVRSTSQVRPMVLPDVIVCTNSSTTRPFST